MKATPTRNLFALVFAGVLLLPAATFADETNHWHFDASLNLFMAGISGDVTARGIPANVNASFGDILENLEATVAGKVRAGYDRWTVATEFSYMKLGASTSSARVRLDQWLVEPSLNYRVCDFFESFAGARYNNISGDVKVTGPLGVTRGSTGTQDWWDPIVGAQLSLPLVGKKLTLEGHFDVGGFGVGSEFTWQAYPYLNWRFTKWGSAQLGYRWLGTDYENGSGRSKFVYDVVVQGPQLGFTVHF